MTQPPRFAAVITAAVIAVVFGVMLLLELRRPLRRSVESKARRTVRNLTTGATALAVAILLETPLLVPISRWTMLHRAGLLNGVSMPAAVQTVLSILLLDYTLWFWHYANHRVPFLWRFHLVHHVDRDMDTSTALRFHFGEHALSMLYRAAQIVILGATPFAVWTWQVILFASILFHHSNLELPIAWERRLVRFVVTPRMHGVHHSDQLSETNSNWSSLFSCWDYLHRTILLAVPQNEVTIGVPAYRTASDVTIGRILLLPFVRQRSDFHLSDGRISNRSHEDVRTSLAD
ncbi:MAG TPA: sterol desaturase family protein [Thermoanaerobaculia bacterium]|jgi:sterol desaturase/sphingolipid hydroxylase (fatty acid hydroxylase superfamily)